MQLKWKFAVSLALLTFAGTAQAQSVRVIDGDTIVLDRIHYRLWAIDAPETHQTCANAWLAGQEATAYMRRLVEGHTMIREARGQDRYGRTIGLCHADGVDIQAEMVKAGMAWAFDRYSRDYDAEPERAKAAGLHALEIATRTDAPIHWPPQVTLCSADAGLRSR
jgi:endonuclease YncB( thermonuclease family)